VGGCEVGGGLAIEVVGWTLGGIRGVESVVLVVRRGVLLWSGVVLEVMLFGSDRGISQPRCWPVRDTLARVESFMLMTATMTT
jgi:hypothetical protein